MLYSNGYSILSEKEILPEEKFEQTLSVCSNVYLAPWRSLLKCGKLHLIKIPPNCSATILKWEWEIDSISSLIQKSSISQIFCTSTGRRCPLRTFLYPDYVAPDIVDESPKSGVVFMGWRNNELRSRIFQDYSSVFSVTLRDSYASNESNANHRLEYTNSLARASVCLCPKGAGSGTRRFWESMAAGAVPLLVSDQMLLPKIWDWDSTIIRVSEARAMYSKDSLFNATITSSLEKKRDMCRKSHQFFSNPTNVSSYINNVIS
jgi:hypothetical protein